VRALSRDPYFELFCGEEFFRHKLPFDRSSLTRWRPRMAEEKLVALIQESLSATTRAGAAKPLDFSKVIVDTAVQPKAVAFPTDAKLMHWARERLVKLAKKHGVRLRQSYARVGKRALIACQRYAQAKQFKRTNQAQPAHLSRAGVARKTRNDATLRKICAEPLSLAFRVRHQRQNQHGRKSLHSGVGSEGLFSARARGRMHGQGQGASAYEFGAKVSLATALARSKGDRLFAHVKTLPGNPYDRHTLETVIPEIEALIGANLSRIVADRGYRGHNVPPDHKMKVYISGLKRGVTEVIKRDRRRRSAVESVRAPLRPQLPQRRPWRRRQRRARRRRLQLVWGIVCQARFIKSVLLSSSFSPR